MEELDGHALYSLGCRDLARLEASAPVWRQKVVHSRSWAICLARELPAISLSEVCLEALSCTGKAEIKKALHRLLASKLGLMVQSRWLEDSDEFWPMEPSPMLLRTIEEVETFSFKVDQARARILRNMRAGAEFYGMNLVRIAWPAQDCVSHPIIFDSLHRASGCQKIVLQLQWSCDSVQFRALPEELSLGVSGDEIRSSPNPEVLMLDIWTTSQKPLICTRSAIVKVDGRWWDAHGICAGRMDNDALSQTLEEGVWCMLCMTDITSSPTHLEQRGTNGYSFLNGLGLEAL